MSVDDNLRFRRQFLLTDRPADISGTCLQETGFGPYRLYHHPDLPLTLHGTGAPVLALLGYILDPDRPEASNSYILATLAESPEVEQTLYRLSGRFALLIRQASGLFVYQDPCGLRTVYYRWTGRGLAIGSSPPILALAEPLAPGERHRAFTTSSYIRSQREHWLPTGTTLYEDVHQLVPNHYLRTEDLSQIRYWPRSHLVPCVLPEAVERISLILRQSITAMARRSKLSLPLTAGLDSRILLAAAHEEAKEIYFYTLRYRDLNRASPDIRIPRRLLRRLGLSHHLIDCRAKAPPDFVAIYEANTIPSHLHDWGTIAYGMLRGLPPDRVAVKGNCSETGRCQLYPSGQADPDPRPDFFVDHYTGWEELPFLKQATAGWLVEARPAAQACGFALLDLYHWEERQGGWQGQSQLEWDIAQEVFTPFNNRELLERMLSTPPCHRIGPDHELYRQIMLRLWPEVLTEPINPPDRKPLAPLRKALRPLWHHIRGRNRR